MVKKTNSIIFKDRRFSRKAVTEIVDIVNGFPHLSRAELANTVCELFTWKRESGRLKTVESVQFLQHLEALGLVRLPGLKPNGVKGKRHVAGRTRQGVSQEALSCGLSDIEPIYLTRIASRKERDLWYEYVDRYHYHGYRRPFGAQIRYFVKAEGNNARILGCLQFSSPAWKMAPRDRWIGWRETQRRRNLQKIVNNSRFLLLPWIKIKNLASSVLSLAGRRLPDDWEAIYGVRPVVFETLVDSNRFQGTCYKASNWICLGETSGRGRMDRGHERHGKAPKHIYVYPLYRRFRQDLLS